MTSPVLQDTSEGTILNVLVQPRASRTEVVGQHGDALKIRVAAPPSDGAANDALCRFLSRQCAVPRSAVTILAGSGARRKRVLVKGVSAEAVRRSLDRDCVTKREAE